ncbi:hypothetical protein BT96DRAFT_113833 [Gymnopus androsaceus JB14]|uniref:Glucose-methanol-choline oxidoreductase C-terminal domain-containing protein n=1 Tax=Gymnopus androsaceus JB14 TaxID=1447944 RepID=A0A6A4HGV0_9AGAR|nr:hypothetical protein BT96DRAFT_113833 [Gymnopus androsaceus JB14]
MISFGRRFKRDWRPCTIRWALVVCLPLQTGDSELRVHEVDGLRICDASVFPSMISGHSAAAVIETAKKLADVLLQSACK